MAALVAGGWVFTMLGKEFVTAEDEGRFMVRLEMPLSYSLEKTDSVLQRFEKELNKLPEVNQLLLGLRLRGLQQGPGLCEPDPKDRAGAQPDWSCKSMVRGLLRQMPDVRGTVAISPLGAGSRNEDIQFVIQGPASTSIDNTPASSWRSLEKTPGYVGITRDLEIGKPEIRVKIDRNRAADAGVSVREVATAVAALLGGVKTVEYKRGRQELRRAGAPDAEEQRSAARGHPAHLAARRGRPPVGCVQLRDPGAGGGAQRDQPPGPQPFGHGLRQPGGQAHGRGHGRGAGHGRRDAARGLHHSSSWAGPRPLQETTGYIACSPSSWPSLLTYMVLAAQFESFVHPFAIMMGLPLSFIGAFGLLFLLGNSFNLFSMIGLILLVGLATKNGILLIDYTRQLRLEKGMGAHEALIEAGATRLRPILMTAVSTIGGVLPVVLALGVGSESRQPMAVAIAGGMVSSTVLTLLVVPVVYSYLDQFTNWKLIQWIQHRFMAPDAIKNSHGKQS